MSTGWELKTAATILGAAARGSTGHVKRGGSQQQQRNAEERERGYTGTGVPASKLPTETRQQNSKKGTGTTHSPRSETMLGSVSIVAKLPPRLLAPEPLRERSLSVQYESDNRNSRLQRANNRNEARRREHERTGVQLYTPRNVNVFRLEAADHFLASPACRFLSAQVHLARHEAHDNNTHARH